MVRTVATVAAAFQKKAQTGAGARVAVSDENASLMLLELLRLGFRVAADMIDDVPDVELRERLKIVLCSAGACGAVGLVIGRSLGGPPGAAIGMAIGALVGAASASAYLAISVTMRNDGGRYVTFAVEPVG